MPLQTFFLHGLDSSGNGTKGRFFARHYGEVIRPDFHGTLNERLQQLEALCDAEASQRFVGSSFGALMACCYAIQHPARTQFLVLLAPALNFNEFKPPPARIDVPTIVVIGKNDTVTPPDLVIPLAKATCSNLQIHLVDDDHMLHTTFPGLDWSAWLSKG